MSQVTDQIKERIDIIDLIREYIPELKKAGVSWKARCPFHQEKTPSFVVSPEKGIWHCFGCHEGGDIFAFIKKAEGIEFADALRLLASRAGVKLERQDPRAESERGRNLDVVRLASQWYHQVLLRSKSGEAARNYIAGRGLKAETMAEWQLGFAPDAWDELFKYLQSRGFKAGELAAAGLAVSNNRGGYYDRFRYRLLFPIQDVHGNVVGFTGRKLREEDVGGKYINTPETGLYHKSQILFGLHRAKAAIRKEGLAVVVEGNMDCISSHQAGVTNVVAASGTAVTPEQVKLLKRFTNTICLAFDPDLAGQAALMRGLEVAWQEDMVVQIVVLPKGLDPDALIKRNPEDWKKLTDERENFLDWLFIKARSDWDINTAAGKKQAGRLLLPWIRRLPDAIEQTHYLQLLGRELNVSEPVLRAILERAQTHLSGGQVKNPARRARPAESGAAKATKRDVLEAAAVRLLALVWRTRNPRLILRDFSVDCLPNDPLISLYKSLDLFYDKSAIINPEDWLAGLPETLHGLAREVLLLSEELLLTLDDKEVESEARELRERLRLNFTKQRLSLVRGQIQAAERTGNLEVMQKHLAEWKKLSQELQAK